MMLAIISENKCFQINNDTVTVQKKSLMEQDRFWRSVKHAPPKMSQNSCDVVCPQELTENQGGVNPDYGLQTPTLVSPPKHSRGTLEGI